MQAPGCWRARIVWLCGLLAILAAGCAIDDSQEHLAPPLTLAGEISVKEDADVAAYLKRKGWSLFRDQRISDGKRLVFLTVDQKEPTLSADDYKMLARVKTAQLLDLKNVNATDDGLKVIATNSRLEAILVAGESVTDAGIKALAGCRSLDNVYLVSTKKVTDAGIKELAGLPKLQTLYLMDMTLSGAAFEAFAGHKTLESVQLEYVDGLADEGVRHLVRVPNLNALKIGIGFGESKLTTAGIRGLVDARLPAEFEFDLRLLDDGLLEALVAKGWLYGPTRPGAWEKKPATAEEVKVISLGGSQVTDTGMQAVLNCTNATHLFLRRTGITDETLKKLASFKSLSYLQLDRTKVNAAGLDAVARLPIDHVAMQGCELSENAFKTFGKMTALKELWLDDAKMKPEWLMHIAHLPKLEELNLDATDFDDAAVMHVSTLPSLQELTLNNTKLGDTGFLQLLKLPKLKTLMVNHTKVSKEVYQKAKKDHPKLRLYFSAYD